MLCGFRAIAATERTEISSMMCKLVTVHETDVPPQQEYTIISTQAKYDEINVTGQLACHPKLCCSFCPAKSSCCKHRLGELKHVPDMFSPADSLIVDSLHARRKSACPCSAFQKFWIQYLNTGCLLDQHIQSRLHCEAGHLILPSSFLIERTRMTYHSSSRQSDAFIC